MMKQSIAKLQRFPRDKQMALSSAAMMRHVLYALIPGLLLQTVFFGWGVLLQLFTAMLTALICEFAVALLRRRTLTALDCSSGLVTAALLAASVPAVAPWWLVVVAVAFGLLFGKHVYGGMGFNVFNPAIVGFCVVYLSFPLQMSLYPSAPIGLADSLALVFSSTPLDAFAGATELAGLKANGVFDNPTFTHWWLNAAWLLGGIYLWLRQIADWRLSLVFFVVFVGLIGIFDLANDSPINTLQHVGLGALVFTTCFIITDPTTAATGRLGRLIYATLAAVIAVLIRQYSNMPDSMAFAILLANLAAPMIDNYTRPQYIRY